MHQPQLSGNEHSVKWKEVENKTKQNKTLHGRCALFCGLPCYPWWESMILGGVCPTRSFHERLWTYHFLLPSSSSPEEELVWLHANHFSPFWQPVWGVLCNSIWRPSSRSETGALQAFVPAFPSLLADPFLSPRLSHPSNLQQERRWEREKVTNCLCSPFSCLATDRAWLTVGKDPRIQCGSPLCDRGEQGFCTQCTADETWSFQWQPNPHMYSLCNFCKAWEQKHFTASCWCQDYNASRTARSDSGEGRSSFQHLANTCVSSASGHWLHLSYHEARWSLTSADSAPLGWVSPL